MARLLTFRANYGSQILLYDSASIEEAIELDYGDVAYSRGYAVAHGAIAVFPIVEDAYTEVSVWDDGPVHEASFDKLVQVPICLETGELCIADPGDLVEKVSVRRGEYLATIGQNKAYDGTELKIQIFLVQTE